MKLLNKKSGFTLIESLVYLAIFSLVFATIVQFSITTQENNRVALYRKELGDLIMIVNSNIEESFSSSTSINTSNSTFNNNNGSLALISANGQNISYYLQNGRLKVNRDSQINDLTSADFNCTKFNPQPISSSTINIGIRLTIQCNSIKVPRINSEFITNYII